MYRATPLRPARLIGAYLDARSIEHYLVNAGGESATGRSSATILGIGPVLADVAATRVMIDGMHNYAALTREPQIDDFLLTGESREPPASRSMLGKLEIMVARKIEIVN